MNFATFTTATGGHFITGTPMPMAKMQQTVATSNAAMPQVVSVVGGTDGMQYVRALDGGATLAPQLITLPITLPGTKPGDPQQTVQIQVLSPNIALQQPQPKYQMQIPIQGLQQGAVLTLAYAPETNDGVQIIRNAMPDGLQMVTLPQEMQVIQTQDSKDQLQMLQQQMVNAPQQQIVINNMAMATDDKMINNNNIEQIIVKEECEEDTNDDSCQDMDCSEATATGEDLANYLQKVPSQSTATLPLSLQKFLILNTGERSAAAAADAAPHKHSVEIQINPEQRDDNIDDDAKVKKKKRYKKKSPKPAKPKPGQVVITTSKDGSPLYCCPECSLVYSEKEQLEVHLVVHKIERRFICGICGAGLKRKEHLERHKLGHNPERPYVCAVCRKGFKRREHLNLHTVIHSGVKTEMCLECGKGFYRKDHLRKHARSHESKRAREELLQGGGGGGGGGGEDKPALERGLGAVLHGDSAEITIHVPTSANVQVPVQINIPQHVVSSLSQAQFTNLTQHASTASSQHSAQATLDALLAQHT